MRRTVLFLALCILGAAPGVAAEKPAASGGPHSLRMEELEVRGLREKPEVLYLPVHRGITSPSPVRYDLFLKDMARPTRGSCGYLQSMDAPCLGIPSARGASGGTSRGKTGRTMSSRNRS
ncbi:MAG: hypothetical protein H6Q84_720 [Deltaproteobacteria bacterium]|nr:hypothetical protein [Deltaproteobacteria bacterium]